MSTKKWIVLSIVVLMVALFFVFDLGRFFTLEQLQAARIDVRAWVEANPVVSRVGYFVGYVVVTALSLPGAAIMTLAGGAVFGLTWGVLLVSFASSIGATAAFLISRTVLGDWVQRRFAAELRGVNDGFQRDGAFYLFGLRMVPLVPFFVVNLVMGITRMPVVTFYVTSQLGMFAATVVYVFAGTQLAQVQSLSDILNPGLILALTLLGLFPIVARKALDVLKARRGKS